MSWRLALQLVHSAYAQQGVLTSSNRSSLWTGPVLTEPSQAAARRASSSSANITVGLQAFSAQGLALRDVHDCTTCCAGASPFEVFNGTSWRRVRPNSLAGASVRLPATAGDSYVRYAWSDFVQCVLVNNDSLPLGPFQLEVLPAAPLEAASAPTSNFTTAPQPVSKPPRGMNTWNFYVSVC